MRMLLALVLLGACQVTEPTEAPPLYVCPSAANLGITPLHRLSGSEIARACGDMFGLSDIAVDRLPTEDRVSGFSNQTSGQDITATYARAWSSLAAEVSAAAAGDVPTVVSTEMESLPHTEGALEDLTETGGGAWWVLTWGDEGIDLPVELPDAGTWRLTVRARWWFGWEQLVGAGDPNIAHLLVDGTEVATAPIVGTWYEPADLEFELSGEAGPRDVRLEMEWVGSEYSVAGVNSVGFDLYLMEGPLEGSPTPLHDALASCEASGGESIACATEVAAGVARRAWSRPVTGAERSALGSLVQLAVDEGDAAHVGLGLALDAVLLSPDFLFDLEPRTQPGSHYPVGPHALARRLARLVWGSLPDDTLLDCADSGLLHPLTPGGCGLSAQLERMLEDPRSATLVEGFGFEWLELDALQGTFRDPERFVGFDDELVDAMLDETRRALDEAWLEGPPVSSLLQSGEVEASPRLLEHYGEIAAGTRGAVLQHASVLTATSQGTRTSPSHRATFVLDRFLCDPPGRPPADVAPLDASAAETSVADALAAHTNNPACSGCHAGLDPYGNGLEQYDAVGAWRETAPDGTALPSTGELPDGRVFDGAADYVGLIRDDPQLSGCIAQQLFTWGLQRRPGPGERWVVEHMAEGDAGLPHMLERLVSSPSLACRRVPTP